MPKRDNTSTIVSGRKVWLLMLAALAGCAAFGSPPSRIREHLEDGQTFVLEGNTHPVVASAGDQGEVPGSLAMPRIVLRFRMTGLQQADLTRLLASQQDPSSPAYRKWLTPEQFGNRFGLSQSDLNKVKDWLRNMGFSNLEVARSRNSVSMSGTAAHVQYAFQTSVHHYLINGSLHYANASNPVLPHALEGLVSSVRGLNDLRPRARVRTRVNPRFTSSVSGNHYFAPGDFATVYDVQALYNSGTDGTGQKIAIAGQTDIQISDIEAFQNAAGLTVKDPTVVLDGVDPGTHSGDVSEADLDIEWAGAVARGATIVYVNSSDVFTSALYAINQNLAPVLSLTYGLCEAQAGSAEINGMSSAFQQANAQGMTVIAAAGDVGAADCDESATPGTPPVAIATKGLAVDFPGSSPNVTAIGGTEFSEGNLNYWSTSNNNTGGSALSYIPETAWNGTAAEGNLAATGGGTSTVFGKPAWQVGTGVPADGKRDVPDLALDSSPDHEGYLICSGGSCVNGFRRADQTLNVTGGTSVAAPTFAGIVALINQLTGTTQGNINPRLYTLASVSANAFHDVTTGNNLVPCQLGTPNCTTGSMGYIAGVGYDQATGLGSVDANNLVRDWAPSFQVTANPATLTVADSSTGTSTVTIGAVGGFTGTVSFTCSVPSTLTNTTCSIPGTVSGSGTTPLTIANSTVAGSAFRFPFASLPSSGDSKLPVSAGLLIAAAVGMMLFPRRQTRGLIGSVAAFSVVMLASCGGSSGGSGTSQTVQPTVTGTVTVTAISSPTALSAVITKTATLAVTEP